MNPRRNDPGIWHHAHDNLKSHLHTHERAIILLDEYFGGSNGAESLTAEISKNLRESGWDDERFAVIVIQPMFEAWLWADNQNVAQAFGFADFRSLQEALAAQQFWAAGEPKPLPEKMKEAKAAAIKLGGKKRFASRPFVKVFQGISSRALDACAEPGFQKLRRTLQTWFPAEGGQP
ncbi:MAG: hypothetical protein JJT96_15080 [Opitutales bacterium]|nr:hypothetical protein [Opitutales bacterium]